MKMKNEIDDIIAVTRNLQLIQSEFELMEDVTHQKDSFKEQRQTVFDEIWDFLGVEANGEDVFEVEVPHKFVVRSDKYSYIGEYTYVAIRNYMTTTTLILSSATKFDTREEAQEWANSHQVVVEIDEEGNEVE